LVNTKSDLDPPLDGAEWEDINPINWQYRTNIQEHKQFVEKINEIIKALNAGTTAPVDPKPTAGSKHLVASGGVYDADNEVLQVASQAEMKAILAGKAADAAMSKITNADKVPTAGSENLVKSGGVYQADEAIDITAHSALGKAEVVEKQVAHVMELINGADWNPTKGSHNLIKSGGVYEALEKHTIEMDEYPDKGSPNAVRSRGLYEMFEAAKQDRIDIRGKVSEAYDRSTEALQKAENAVNKAEGAVNQAELALKAAGQVEKIALGADKKADEALEISRPLPASIADVRDMAYQAQVDANDAKNTAGQAWDAAKEALEIVNKMFVDVTGSVSIGPGQTWKWGRFTLINNRVFLIDVEIEVTSNEPIFRCEFLQHIYGDDHIVGYIIQRMECKQYVFEISDGAVLNSPHVRGRVFFRSHIILRPNETNVSTPTKPAVWNTEQIGEHTVYTPPTLVPKELKVPDKSTTAKDCVDPQYSGDRGGEPSSPNKCREGLGIGHMSQDTKAKCYMSKEDPPLTLYGDNY